MSQDKQSLLRRHSQLKLWGMIVVVCVVVFGASLWFSTPREPHFEGKALSTWLAKLNTGRFDVVDLNPVLDSEAASAVKSIGEPAVPFLIARLKSALKAERTFYSLQDWPTKLLFKFMEAKLEKRMELGNQAVLGFLALGERGKSAMPQLEAMIHGNEVSVRSVFQALAANPGSLSIFSNALQSDNRWWRSYALQAVRHLGPSNVMLVPQIIATLDDPNWERISPFAVRALGRIGQPSELIEPALRRSLLSTKRFFGSKRSVWVHVDGESGTRRHTRNRKTDGNPGWEGQCLCSLIFDCTFYKRSATIAINGEG
ncbi:MAG: HEAT repeat domain-containing protein [Verrucomicrobiota bacterium]